MRRTRITSASRNVLRAGRSWVDDGDYSGWRIVFDGVVKSYRVDPDELLVYWFDLRDSREFEREKSLFFSNYVIFGTEEKSGPGRVDCGARGVRGAVHRRRA